MLVEFGDIATWTAAAAAIYSAFKANKSSEAAEKYQAEAAQEARRAANLMEKNHELELRSWTDQYFLSVRSWADEVCSVISEAIHLVSFGEPTNALMHPILVKLSHLIDTGRWHFPNQWSDDYGLHKEPAYRGVRQPILECLVSAYDALIKFDENKEKKEHLWAVQRAFVSHIQETLDPRSREQEIRKVLDEFEQSQRLRAIPRD